MRWNESKLACFCFFFLKKASRRWDSGDWWGPSISLLWPKPKPIFSPLTTKYCNMYHSCGFICVWFPIKYRKTEEEKTEHWKVFGGFLLLHRQVGAPLVHQTPFLCRQISRKKKDWIYLPLPGSDCTGLHKISTIVEPLSAPTGAFYVTKPFLKFHSVHSILQCTGFTYIPRTKSLEGPPGHDFKVLAFRACLTSSFVPLSLRLFDPHKGDNS